MAPPGHHSAERRWRSGHSGEFFETEEPARAEALLLLAWELDRDNKMRLAALAGFYVRTIAACEFQVPNAMSRPCADPEWTSTAKAGLTSSRSPELIATVAEHLLRAGSAGQQDGTWRDPTFVSRLLERARELQAGK